MNYHPITALRAASAALRSILAGLVLLGAGISSARAAVTVFTDQALWTAAAGAAPISLDNLNTGTLTRTDFTISGTASVFAFPNANPVTAIDGTGYFRPLLEADYPEALFTFNSPIYGLGFELNPQNFNLGVAVGINVNGSPAGSYNLPATDVNGFRGFVSDTPFTTFQILYIPNVAAAAWHGIDNVQSFGAVPEPSSALLLAGSGLLLALRRRRTASL